jgi:subtilisin-like proprotein convertase family protein
VKSNSWGPDDYGTLVEGPGPLTLAALHSAATSGRNGKGTIFLWAAGNGGDVGDDSNYDGYANSIHTIAIGATDSTGGRAYYSEPGSNLVVCAPSDGTGSMLGITTTDRTGSLGYNTASSASGGDYTNDFGGTSSATPTAAGNVALMLEQNPDLGWRDVQEILIRSAHHCRPADAGWATNGAGWQFHHDFGAGLIDAAAAVSLAATWTNLAAQTSTYVTPADLPAAIPDSQAAGVTRSFDLSTTHLRVEHATVKLSVSHTARGNLEITLISPSGMSSRLATPHADTGNDYTNWTFSSVRHWGELATGTWTLKIADLGTSGNTTGGTLTAAELTLYGTATAPVNPAPLVHITQPASGQVFSPETSVTVAITATDLTAAGNPGTLSQVELLDNGSSLGTTSTAPYSFTFVPGSGAHTLVAYATDDDGATGTSAPVAFTVANQAPRITAATLSATGQSYADVPLAVTSVTASDPEGAPLTPFYQWQSSTDGSSFSAEPGATAAELPVAPSHAARLWRCEITVSDGENSSPPFTTAAVNLLTRPPPTATAGEAFTYTSGLVLRGSAAELSRAALINEFSQGSGTAEWVELLTLRAGSFRNWSLADNSNARLTFADSAAWDAIPAGTLIVIYNGAAKDPLLPADTSDPATGRMVLASSDPELFAGSFPAWPSFANSGDAVVLRDATGTVVSQLGYGNDPTWQPNLGTVDSGQAAYYAGGDDLGSATAANWVTTTATVARKPQPRAAGDPFISEYVEGSSNNKAIEIFNPGTAPLDLAATACQLEAYHNGASTPNYTINLTGTIAAGGTHVIKYYQASALIPAQQLSTELSFNGDDALVLKKGGAVIDRFGQVGYDPGTAWTAGGVTTQNQTLRRKPAIHQGDPATGDAFDPSVEWLPFPVDDFSGLGSHTSEPASPALMLSVIPATFSENAGAAAASATVTVATAPAADLTISLTSSDPTAATVPELLTLPAGLTSVEFPVSAVDDPVRDGSQPVTLTATAAGWLAAVAELTVTDDEAPPEGVTPGSANAPANQEFVTALRDGLFELPARFRLGPAAQVPAGLELDPVTGVLAGTLAAEAAPGAYEITIERHNTLGEVVAQTFTLTVFADPESAFTSYLAAAGVPADQRGPADDPDGDGQVNLLEFALGGHPNNAGDNARIHSRLADSDDPDTPGNLLLTIAVRMGTPAFTGTPAPGATHDGLTYSVEGSADLVDFNTLVLVVDPQTAGLPAAPTGYEYRSFSLDRSNHLPAPGFLRVRVTTAP